MAVGSDSASERKKSLLLLGEKVGSLVVLGGLAGAQFGRRRPSLHVLSSLVSAANPA